ncbi:hypothetical protein Q5O14_17975 [Eubacteriaceae bacterium ES2]|nr:hypothetical protein Q5O14_17975 [Eubacteriaceae bacterium ES2]
MGYRFEPKNHSEKIEVFGNTFEIDFGADEVAALIALSGDQETAEKKMYESNLASGMTIEEASEILRGKMKINYESFFNQITGDPKASEKCFNENTPITVLRDLYLFILDIHIKKSAASQGINRSQRRKKKK